MSWSLTASGTSQEAAKSVREQAEKFLGSRSDAEKVVVLGGVDAVSRTADQYPDNNLSVSFHGHADESGISSYSLSISSFKKPQE